MDGESISYNVFVSKKVVTECMSFYMEGSQCLSEYDEITFSDKKEIF